MPEGAIHSPASSGPMPSTSCRYCVMNRNEPSTMNRPSMFVASAALKAGIRNNRKSTSGSAMRLCRRKKSTPTATPRKSTQSAPRRSVFGEALIPGMTASTATADSTALTGSRWPAWGRGTRAAAPAPLSTMSMTGTLIRNTEPHQKCTSSTADHRSDPAPAVKPMIQTPMAPACTFGSGTCC